MAKISIYNGKGRLGKTPMALEIALRLDYNYATNQNRPRDDIRAIIHEDKFLQVEPHDEFFEMEDDFPVIFDLAGEITGYEESIKSALSQSDIILIPVVNQRDTIVATALSIAEIRDFESITENIVLIANMVRSPKDLEEIKESLFPKIGGELPIFPVRYSKAFDRMMTEKKSIHELSSSGGLQAYNFRNVAKELDDLISYIQS